MREALAAWAEDDHAKVSLHAPTGVEHLGKAVLWQESPALLAPTGANAEASLVMLATKPDLANPKLRTIGLAEVLRRLEMYLGELPIPVKRRTRLVEIRNGSIHVGTHDESRHMLQDAVAVCARLLEELGADPARFYGYHYPSVQGLLNDKQTEAGHRVAAARARARSHLTNLEERLGPAFGETMDRFEEYASVDLDADDFGDGLWGVNQPCPECGSVGRLFGRMDGDVDVDIDVEPNGDGTYSTYIAGSGWELWMYPEGYACNVCRLRLNGRDELSEAALPSSRHEVSIRDLDDDFDPDEHVGGMAWRD